MKLPKHLEILKDSEGIVVHGMGPYTLFVRNKETGQVAQICIPRPSPKDEGQLVTFFQKEFARAVKEKLNEDIER